MNNFRTELNPEPSKFKIGYENKAMFIGSCFSENISATMSEHGMRVINNPFGILFHPSAIRDCLDSIITKKKFNGSEFFLHNERYHHFALHSELSHSTLEKSVEEANTRIEFAHEFLKSASVLFITFGTAWVYEHKLSGTTVANCHKISSAEFNKRKLGVNDIVSEFSYLINHLRNFNPGLKIILTISPVRHLKDGFMENSHSKSTLNIAVHEIIRRFDNTDYFPAYELVMDDLRDYRFYNEDMVHPTQQAIDYVFSKFSDVYFESDTKELFNRVEELKKAAAHRPFSQNSDAHIKFLQEQLKKIDELATEKKVAHLDSLRQQFLVQMN